ncbi:N-formylglutamate amidohydrolase [Paraglaciecola hydrolytica]|uniref:N-formylglutamate amidohydrolase n=1 Tax=Paraglaciecola hydrolytica TaxID=1799789 RepID=A0A136A609_9ALTE|nr:N-formylglutamate amidohydrolase [Paraglaciecola hydrolytica]KXI30662.1 N-formylglutamate amidohydrolase [Paraglaciecola hydrolytica]
MILPYTLISPCDEQALPLVFDSPHSGDVFPADFVSKVSKQQLKTGWDAFVGELWRGVVDNNAYLLLATISRMYIDLNRAPYDIDPALLDQTWDFCQPTKYSDRGMGLIRRMALPGVPIYDQTLSQVQIQARLDHYYHPYHNVLQQKLDSLHQTHGGVWHIDCHSMKSRGNGMNIDSGLLRPDIILGDNDGCSASAEFVKVVEDAFIERGYYVVRNKPYKGGYLVTHYADVANNRHSLQIEVNRSLYMNEESFRPNPNYEKFQTDLNRVSAKIADYVASQI